MSDKLRQAAETILREFQSTETELAAHELAEHYLASHPADGDELVDEAFLRELGFKLLIFPVFTVGDPLIDVEIHLGKRTAKVGTVNIKFPATKNDLRSLLAALGVPTC